jgi:hypothetical protein
MEREETVEERMMLGHRTYGLARRMGEYDDIKTREYKCQVTTYTLSLIILFMLNIATPHGLHVFSHTLPCVDQEPAGNHMLLH